MSAPPTPEALELHRAACARREQGYLDPASGLFSPTSFFLRARGYCCGLGCRHCPWPPAEQARAGRSPELPCWPEPPAD